MDRKKMHPMSLIEFNNKYHIERKISQGSFGKVFRIRDCLTYEQKALKRIQLRKDDKLGQIMREIQIQNFLQHPLVTKIFEFYINENKNNFFKEKTQIGIIMELGGKSLLQLIKDKNQEFLIQQIINFSYEFVKLFAYFQDQNIVHRDIKPQNFVQFHKGLQCKLIDFGLCTHIDDINTVAGSLYYLSPLLKKLHFNKKLNITTNPFKDDVYSFGLTLYQLITRKMGDRQLKKISSNVYRQTKCQELAEIIENMLQHEEEKRPDFKELYHIFRSKFTFLSQIYKPQQFENDFQIDDQDNNSRISKLSVQENSRVSPVKMQIMNEYQYFQNQELQISIHTRTNKIQQIDLSKQNKLYDVITTYKNQNYQSQYQINVSKKAYVLDQDIQVMSVIKMKEIIICGCTDGKIRIINNVNKSNNHVYEVRGTQKFHRRPISVLQKDKNGGLWTGCTDGKLLLWSRNQFLLPLLNQANYKCQQKQEINIFGRKNKRTLYFVDLDTQAALEINLSDKKLGGISTLLCYDKENFVVGFNNGYVFTMWKGENNYYQAHGQPVTSAKIFHNRLYTSGLDGCIKVFDLEKGYLQSKFFHFQNQICNFQVSVCGNQSRLNIMSTEGKLFTYSNCNDKQADRIDKPNQSLSVTLCALFLDGNIFSLSIDGALMKNDQIIFSNLGEGWNCMAADGDTGLILGSFNGQIIFLDWSSTRQQK